MPALGIAGTTHSDEVGLAEILTGSSWATWLTWRREKWAATQRGSTPRRKKDGVLDSRLQGHRLLLLPY